MYPVMALVKVTVIQSLDSSALGPKVVENTVTYNGTTCPGETRAQYCPAYYFYRDGRGSWQVA
jgi:hypothetical protein